MEGLTTLVVLTFTLCDAPSIIESGAKALWLFERQRVPQRPPDSRSTGQPAGPRHTGDFFWFVFFFAKENEHCRCLALNLVFTHVEPQSGQG